MRDIEIPPSLPSPYKCKTCQHYIASVELSGGVHTFDYCRLDITSQCTYKESQLSIMTKQLNEEQIKELEILQTEFIKEDEMRI